MKTHLTLKSFSELSTEETARSRLVQRASNGPALSLPAGKPEQTRSQVRGSESLKSANDILRRYEAPFNVSSDSAAYARVTEVTLTGEGQCAKCVLHETKACQNTITVEEHGRKAIYFLTQNRVSNDFHDQICHAPATITVTGAINEGRGRMELTPTRIELVK